MTREYFNQIFKEFINSTNDFYEEKLTFLLYKVPFISCEYITIFDKTKNNKHYNWDYKRNIGNIKTIDEDRTEEKLIKELEDTVVYKNGDSLYIFGDDYYIYRDGYEFTFFNETGIIPEWFLNSLIYIEDKNLPKITLLSGFTNTGIRSMQSTIKKIEFDKDNYNDDIPNDKICEFIEKEDESGLIILHGNPGSGKSYYIRSLINDHRNKEWVYIDTQDFETLCNNKQYLLSLKNSVLVVEDCEALLSSRNNFYNSYISNLLNITDGLMGDGLCIKIICTFNTNMTNIDSALLRKGRIKIDYDFGELTTDKIKNLCKKRNIKYNKDYKLLCDVYNPTEKVVTKSNKFNKIGF